MSSPQEEIRRVPMPDPRGPLSAYVVDALRGPVRGLGAPPAVEDDALAGDDFHLALYLCYELHYADVAGADPAWEWDPGLLAFRGLLEDAFEKELTWSCPPAEDAGAIPETLFALAGAESETSLSRYVQSHATVAQVEEFVVHRSAYHLKEADPHSWAIPRLAGAPKSALVEIQADEYGAGDPASMHSALFARTMRALGLDDSYGAYVPRLPGITLAGVNLMSMFGLHRRRRGALVGHLALFEMTSTEPNRRYGDGLRRLGFGEDATAFYDEHVEADAVHENIAAYDLARAFARAEPELAPDVTFGASCLHHVEERWAAYLLSCWDSGRSSLL
jgi:hypothetical protein